MHESTITNTTRALSTLASLPCPRCGTIDQPSIGPGKGPHRARARCRHCTGVPDNQPETPAVPVPDASPRCPTYGTPRPPFALHARTLIDQLRQQRGQA